MANDDHVALLKKDVDAWNRWRGENPNVVLDLRGAPLGGADLRVANLSGADLRVADLSAAQLSGADLRQADLSGAILHDTELFQADLRGRTSRRRTYLLPGWWRQILRALISPAVASMAHRHGV